MRSWEIGQAQSIGARREQQDRGEAFVLDDARTCLLVVADGMGGRAGGSEAAAAVITCARVMMQQHADARAIDGPALMRDIALSAHETIRAMTDDPDTGPRASTASAATSWWSAPRISPWSSFWSIWARSTRPKRSSIPTVR
jgi:serine/threonine protein phosphatase PrpC